LVKILLVINFKLIILEMVNRIANDKYKMSMIIKQFDIKKLIAQTL
jgi:hypothetical protein